MTLAPLPEIVLATTVDDTIKGIPGGVRSLHVADIASRNWNLLAEDLPLPLAVLKQSALDHNSAWMRQFLDLSGAVLAPHGKTSMSPQLFRHQIDDGAWGITLATAAQVQVARRFGIGRILLANQLVGKQAIRYVVDELRDDPDFDFYCLVDSVDNVETLAAVVGASELDRPLQVLIEGGIAGRRTGCRSLEDAMLVARRVKALGPHLCLRGVEGFEGVISAPDHQETVRRVSDFVDFLVAIAHNCAADDLFAAGPVILSAGGSAYFDIVVRRFADAALGRETLLVIRSGCYLTHDSVMYKNFMSDLLARSPEARDLGAPPQAALEIWAYVQSRPEPGRAIATIGKRDCSYDRGLPKPFAWYRPGNACAPQPIGEGHVCVEVNDQHAFIDLPADSALRVGDMVGFGISHPCLTFDKWQLIPVVDDDYTVVSAVRTFF